MAQCSTWHIYYDTSVICSDSVCRLCPDVQQGMLTVGSDDVWIVGHIVHADLKRNRVH